MTGEPGRSDLPLTRWQAAAEDYRARQGWSAFCVDTVVWAYPRQFEALNVSRRLGHLVLAALGRRAIAVPVIEIPGASARWVFLTRPYLGAAERIVGVFAGQDVGYAHSLPGSPWVVRLPPTRQPDQAELTWVTSPDVSLPRLSAVARTIQQALGGRDPTRRGR
ncbi:MAG TPA: hypothetical protein VG317_01665 [Pseudonocardiaceae bacterium]|nr:hypothetical protein [Pseudonocardiaceae bacterium]